MKVNLTIIFVTVALVAVVGFAGAVVLTISDKDASAFYGFLTTTLTTVVGFGGTLYGLNKLGSKTDEISEKTNEVKANVNGNLSKLIELATANASTRDEARQVREVAERTGITTGTVPTQDAA